MVAEHPSRACDQVLGPVQPERYFQTAGLTQDGTSAERFLTEFWTEFSQLHMASLPSS